MSKQYKEVEIIAYETVDGTCRIQYKDHVIQTYGYDSDNKLTHFVIDENGQDVGDVDCLLKAIKLIDKRVKKNA